MIKEAEKFAAGNRMEGMVSLRAVLDAPQSGVNDRTILRVLYADSAAKKRPREYAFLRAKAAERGFDLQVLPEKEIRSLAVGTTHGGVLAECSDRTLPSLTESAVLPNGFYVMLEGIEDPYNFGYALRSLYAAGVSGIVLCPRNWMSAAGVVCRSSAGASERLPMFLCAPEEAPAIFHARGYRVIGADIDDSISVYDAALSYPLFLIVGGEKRGISAKTKKQLDGIVRLDYARTDADALSAASAASVLAFEIFRQNREKRSERSSL